MSRERENGFTLVELLVVVVIIGILAAIGIPRLLAQRERARDAAAISDLRALVAVEVALEATTGLTDVPMEIEQTGWRVSDPRIIVCADVPPSGDDIELTAWHADGATVYSWSRSAPRISGSSIPLPVNCAGMGQAVS